MSWTTFGLKVTTPLFNGDDTENGLRVSSIRGVVRFWFRAFAGTRVGNDVGKLAKLEQEIFGSTRHRARVRLRVPQPPNDSFFVKKKGGLPLSGEEGKWIAYLLGQGLTTYSERSKTFVSTRPFTMPGREFELKVRFSGDERVDSLTMAGLWLACTYGGFGARTRKGFGGVRLIHRGGHLPKIWEKHGADTPGIEHFRAWEHLPVSGALEKCAARFLPPPGERSEETPRYPTLGEGCTIAALGEVSGGGWREVMAETGEMYRRFRASREYPDATYKPAIKTPDYEDVLYGDDDRFGLGALGLPIVFNKGAAANVFRGAEPHRRASPLWFRFVEDGAYRWRLFSFAFHNEFLPGPDAPEVRVTSEKHRQRKVTVGTGDVRRKTREWMETIAPSSDRR